MKQTEHMVDDTTTAQEQADTVQRTWSATVAKCKPTPEPKRDAQLSMNRKAEELIAAWANGEEKTNEQRLAFLAGMRAGLEFATWKP